MKPYYERNGVTLYHGDWMLIDLPPVDCVITDPPFSARTHKGYDASAYGHKGEGNDGSRRRELGYKPMTPESVAAAVKKMHSLTDGWIACFTDHTLVPAYQAAYEAAGRYSFAPVVFYSPGRSIRLSGDGPSSWSDWIMVSRTARDCRWGTLPGGYSRTGRDAERIGGKPLALMYCLVNDYSRPGHLVLDPYCGSGTTLLAAQSLGRPAIGVELEEAMCEVSARRLDKAQTEEPTFSMFTEAQ